MSTFQGSELYQTSDQIAATMEAAYQAAVPDIWLGEDGILSIIINVESGAIEGLYLANQLVLQDLFIQTADLQSLQNYGIMFGVPQLPGLPAVGDLLFGGAGGTFIPIGTQASLDPGGGGDLLNFDTTQEATIPNPGIPTVPVATNAGISTLPTLASGSTLASGASITSTDGNYQLTMQTGGNLVLTFLPSSTVIWQTGTSSAGSYLEMATSGELIVYNSGGSIVEWQSGTTDAGSYMAVLGYNIGAVVILDGTTGAAQWSSSGILPSGGILIGNLTGTFEYEITFVTNAGETLPGTASNGQIISDGQILLSDIPLGGAGTLQRNIYRQVNNGGFELIWNLSDNTTTVWQDCISDPISTQSPPLNSTAEQVLVTAQSDQNGSAYDAVPGTITILASPPAGLTSVINPNYFTDGEDPETTTAYQTRLLNWIRGPQTGSPTDLENWAMTVSGVSSATCFTNTPQNGSATVLIGGPGGAIATPALIAQVQALLDSKTLANITIIVSTYTSVTQAVTVNITPINGYLTANLAPSVSTAIANYINSVAAGGTIYISGIIQAVLGVQGVQDLSVSVPSSNQTASASDKFTPGTITVTGTP